VRDDRAVDDSLALRRSLGFKLTDTARQLARFVEFVEAAGATTVTTEIAVAWATQPAAHSPAHSSRRLDIVRGFAEHLAAFDPSVEVPPTRLLPARQPTTEPYLYSDADIEALLAAARALSHPMRATTYETLFGLLAVTGMRIGEAIHLDRGDVDLEEGVLIVRHAKFDKARQLPVHATTVEALRRYAATRERLCPRPRAPTFFVSVEGTRLHYANAHLEFQKVAGRAGVGAREPRSRPRPHDLRHTFAVRTLTDWHRQGVDVAVRMSLLSTYLGHVDPEETYWYLHAAPELMAAVAERLQPLEGSWP
jgi:integrase/recombinase XerD